MCVLEAKSIGFGASGRSGGQVNLGLNLGPKALLQKFGTAQGERLIDLVINTPDEVFKSIRENKKMKKTKKMNNLKKKKIFFILKKGNEGE